MDSYFAFKYFEDKFKAIDDRLSRIEKNLSLIVKGVTSMSVELDRLTTEVNETTSVVESAMVLIDGLAEQIRALQNDPVALAALADELDQTNAALAAKIVANTPAAQPPA